MKTYSENHDYTKYKPVAVQVTGYGEDRKYAWGGKVSKEDAEYPMWMPALADKYRFIDLGSELLFKKAQAEHEAKYIAAQLGKVLA